jgi:hypothetical protein
MTKEEKQAYNRRYYETRNTEGWEATTYADRGKAKTKSTLAKKAAIPLPEPVEGAKWIPLTQDKFALLDDADYELVRGHSYYFSKSKTICGGYAMRGSDDLLLHRIIMGLTDPEIKVDHINGDGLDNRRANLRSGTQGQNLKNRSIQKGNKSGYKGSYFDKQANKWRANISIDNKTKYIGLFDTVEETARAYDKKAKEHYGEFAKLNFPDE